MEMNEQIVHEMATVAVGVLGATPPTTTHAPETTKLLIQAMCDRVLPGYTVDANVYGLKHTLVCNFTGPGFNGPIESIPQANPLDQWTYGDIVRIVTAMLTWVKVQEDRRLARETENKGFEEKTATFKARILESLPNATIAFAFKSKTNGTTEPKWYLSVRVKHDSKAVYADIHVSDLEVDVLKTASDAVKSLQEESNAATNE